MTEIVIIITCAVVVAFIAYNFFKSKNGGDNNLLIRSKDEDYT